MKVATIYALLEPTSKEPCYVGQTVNARQRQCSYKQPYRASNERLREWIRLLQCNSQEPLWLELEQCSRGAEADCAEQQWIRLLREMGCDLRNVAGGGTSRTDRRAARVSQSEWLEWGERSKVAFEQAQQFYWDIEHSLPQTHAVVRGAKKAYETLQLLRFTLENAAAEEHPSWNVLGHFVGEAYRPGRMSFGRVERVPASLARVEALRKLVLDNLVTAPMMQPWCCKRTKAHRG